MKNRFRVQIRTKNHSSAPLRGAIFHNNRAIVRLGSLTSNKKAFPKEYANNRRIQEINTEQAIQNSRSKLLMKECFANANIPQAEWYSIEEVNLMAQKGDMNYPIVAKRIFGFKGRGMILITNFEELTAFLNNNNLSGYYFEKFYNYAREYRLHCTQNECFMAWRKLRRSDCEQRWFFNSSNCNWVNPDHELFNIPNNWKNIEEDCIRAIRATGLDIGAVDVRVQSKINPKYIILEVNSAPALGDKGIEIYKEQIIKILNK